MNNVKINSKSQRELEAAAERLDAQNQQVSDIINNRSEMGAPVAVEEQTKMSKKEIKNFDAPKIDPIRSISHPAKFNEVYRKSWERDWEYIKCIVENHEIIGESVETWTKEYAGDPAHFWRVPVNKPVYIPRLLARTLSKCNYHRIIMEDRPTGAGQGMQFYGAVAVDHVKNRISCRSAEVSFNVSGF